MHSNDSCPLCEVAKRFHDVAISQRDAARRERDDLIQENEILRAREEGEPWASFKIRRERDEALARSEKAHEALRAAEKRELSVLADFDEAAALLREAHRELATVEAITVSPSDTDGLLDLVRRMGDFLSRSYSCDARDPKGQPALEREAP